MQILGEEFSPSGHQVKVVTQVPIELERNQDYEVIRSPTVDAGKFPADAPQLPTGRQPEKPSETSSSPLAQGNPPLLT